MNDRVRPLILAGVLSIIVNVTAFERQTTGENLSQVRLDVLIAGGKVMDGTGNPWFSADVGVRDGKIVAIGRLPNAKAVRVIHAEGKLVVPGFIDLHSHADGAARRELTLRSDDSRRRAAPNIVMQGVTTVAVNPDGGGAGPIGEQRAVLERLRIGPNAALFIGHGFIRGQVLGDQHGRAATDAEIGRMKALVHRGMTEGAFGLSAGLEYAPGRWSTTDELVALMSEAALLGGIYIAHQRSESSAPLWWKPSQNSTAQPTLFDGLQETIEIGERTGAVVVATHIKARGSRFLGASRAAIRMIETARTRGVQVYADLYPYTTSGSDRHVSLIPAWIAQTHRDAEEAAPSTNFADALRRHLADPAQAAKVRRDIAYEIEYRGGAESIRVLEHPVSGWIGKSLAEIAASNGSTPVEMAITLQLQGRADRLGGTLLRSSSIWEEDIDAFSAQTWTATASDGGIALPEDGPGVHPRYYGTFPRKIKHYVLDRTAITLEHAVRSMTSLPAQILGIKDRGQIREGFAADLAVLDLSTLSDRGDFEHPHQYPEGVEYVLVNGALVVDRGAPTWSLPGVVIRR